MAKRNWADGQAGNTPLSAGRLKQQAADIAALKQAVRDLGGNI